MAANTVSGIDPTKTMNMIQEINNYKQQMKRILDEINGPIRQEIDRNYEGQAATAMLQRVQQYSIRVDQEMEQIIKNIITNVNQDLDDTKRTDSALAGF